MNQPYIKIKKMEDPDKKETNEQLLEELQALRSKVARLVQAEQEYQEVAQTLQETQTRYQENEKVLRQALDQMEIIFQGVADGITVQDLSGKLVYVNEAAARTTGYSSVADFLAASPQEATSRFEMWDEQGQPFPVLKLPGRLALQDEHEASAVIRFRLRLTGEDHWSIVRARPIFDEQGQVKFAVNIFHEITERKKAEENEHFLSESSAILAASLNYETTLKEIARLSVPYFADWCAVDILQEDGQLHRLSITHKDPLKEEWGRQLQQRYPPNPNDDGGIFRVIRSGQSELASVITTEMLTAAAKNKEQLELILQLGFSSAMLVPLKVRGRTLGVISFVWAESGQHYDKDDLRLAEELARRAAIAVDNSRLYHEAQEAVKRRDEFLTIAAHELRTPLSIMRTGLQFAQKGLKNDPSQANSKMGKAIELAVAQSHRLEGLVDDMADASDAAENNLPLVFETMGLQELTERAVSLVAFLSKQHQIKIEMTVEQSLIVKADKFKLTKALRNLLDNSLKFSPNGGLVWVKIQLASDAPEVYIIINDAGLGIPTERRENLFKPFYQAENGYRTRRFGGLGLGLYVTRAIIEAHGGSISLLDGDGGATFKVILPLVS